MVYKVVSTKLSDEEHEKFLDFCTKKGISSSAAIRDLIEENIMKQSAKEMSIEELEEALGIKRRNN